MDTWKEIASQAFSLNQAGVKLIDNYVAIGYVTWMKKPSVIRNVQYFRGIGTKTE